MAERIDSWVGVSAPRLLPALSGNMAICRAGKGTARTVTGSMCVSVGGNRGAHWRTPHQPHQTKKRGDGDARTNCDGMVLLSGVRLKLSSEHHEPLSLQYGGAMLDTVLGDSVYTATIELELPPQRVSTASPAQGVEQELFEIAVDATSANVAPQ